jgi:hypothetical protein
LFISSLGLCADDDDDDDDDDHTPIEGEIKRTSDGYKEGDDEEGNKRYEDGFFGLCFSGKDPRKRRWGMIERKVEKVTDVEKFKRNVSGGGEIFVTLDYEAGTLSFTDFSTPAYTSTLTNLPLDTPLYPYFFSWNVDFEIFFCQKVA